MAPFSNRIQLVRTYEDQLDLELRVIDIPGKYKKFCLIDKDGCTVPISRKYYTDEYISFMKEFGINDDDLNYLDFASGDDSCIYATYGSPNSTDNNSTNYNSTDYNNTDDDYIDTDIVDKSSSKILLFDDVLQNPIQKLNPSTKICDIAKSIRVSYYKDISQLIPPVFSIMLYTTLKNYLKRNGYMTQA